ncbi:transcriptional regulator [Halobellus inordinatus]|uniref:transcriptional regulator n=1 Tax=Halobellus inordinatus TaxID=1126236 RepID=UPI00210E67A8|nr:ArsR family transcriptional regulator [Halobellus inordinatus]
MSESDDEATTRQRIADALRAEPHGAADLSTAVGVPRSTVYHHLDHVAHSIEGSDADEQFLVAPPECRACGFDSFDDPLNDPSRCPECRSERIAEPQFVID